MMHKLISLKRICGQGFRNFFRNAWLSTAATAIMVVTLTIILSSVAINMILNDNIEDIASRVTVSIYLKDKAPEDKRLILEEALKSNNNVKSVRYINKEEAMAIFIEQNQGNQEIITGASITGNVLPESFEVEVKDLSRIDEVSNIVEVEIYKDLIDETSVNEQRKASIDNIAKAQDYINFGSFIAAGLFAAISILVIFNTIRMAVFTRSTEIEIMKLIGATPSFIRGPFLFEATLYGVFAGIIAVLVVYSALLSLGPRASKSLLLDQTIDFFVTNWALVFLATIGAGVLVGLLSSMVSTARYLRLKRW